MRKKLLLLILLFCLHAEAQKTYSVRMAESQSSNLLKEEWDPASGLLSYALLEVANLYPEEKNLYDLGKNYIDKNIAEDGTIKEFQKGVLENLIPGKVVLDLFCREEQNEKYKNCADWLHNYLVMSYPRIKKNTGKTAFIHEDSYPNQMWLQDLYDGCSFYSQWLKMRDVNNKAAWTDIAVQLLIYEKQAFNPIIGLAYPHWSVEPGKEHSFWASRENVYIGCSKVFTAQSMGYLFASLIDVLENMPKNQAGIKQLKHFLAEVASGVKCWQDDESGCWYQIMNHNDSLTSTNGIANYLESSGSCLLAYGLAKGVRLGLLDKEEYSQVALKAYNGIIKNFVKEENNELNLINCTGYIGVGNGSEMSRDGSIDYYLSGEGVEKQVNNPKAVAAFILACLENEKLY